jgi:hypothetical protein
MTNKKYYDIESKFKEQMSDNLIFNSFITNNSLRTKSERVSTSTSVYSFDTFYKLKIFDTLVNEIKSYLYKKPIDKFYEDKLRLIDFIDLTKFGNDLLKVDNTSEEFNYLLNRILSNGSKNIITNSQVCSLIQSSPYYNFTPHNSKTFNSSLIYETGQIYSKNVYVNPFMKWEDNTIVFIDDVFIDIRDIKISISDQPNNSINIIVDIEYALTDINDTNSEILIILSSKECPNYKKATAVIRNQKIDSILS